MRKIYIFSLIAIITSVCCACGNIDTSLTNTKTNNTLIEDSYVLNDDEKEIYIDIRYPQLAESTASDELIEQINYLIKETALTILSEYSSLDNAQIKVTYDTKCNNDNFISVLFNVNSVVGVQAYPRILCRTVTIDLQTGEQLRLNDMVKVNQEFVDTFFEIATNVRAYSEEWSKESLEAINKSAKESTTLKALTSSDRTTNPDYCSYITDHSLGICVGVPYAIGSYAIYEAEFKDIEEYMKEILLQDKVIT